jgi:hypothetical protein
MPRLVLPLLLLAGAFASTAAGIRATATQTAPKADPPALGDKDDAVFQNQRQLKIKNDTAAKVTVYLQYRTLKSGTWTWLPAEPGEAAEALSFDLDAGQETVVKVNDDPLAASRVRVWANADNRQWLTYKTKDLWLVPERNETGEHVYLADAVQTFALRIALKADGPGGDSDGPGGVVPPSDEDGMPLAVPDPDFSPDGLPWDIVPPWDVVPLVRDLAVLPVKVVGGNAAFRIMNLGHFSMNDGRRLLVQKMTPGSVPVDLGPIGPLYHYAVKHFYLAGMAPGDYRVFIDPSDAPPFDGNDARTFTVAFSDLAVLPVSVVNHKAHVKVKNVGTAPAAAGRHLLVVLDIPGSMPQDLGPIGAVNPGDVKLFVSSTLAPGKYKAYINPGDTAPQDGNDFQYFMVVASDLGVSAPMKVGAKVKATITNNGPGIYATGPRLWYLEKKVGASWVAVPTVGSHVIPTLTVGGSFPVEGTYLGAGEYRIRITAGDANPGNDVMTKILP